MTSAEKTRRQGPWIDLFPLGNMDLTVVNTGERTIIQPELRGFIDGCWVKKRNWKSSWVPFAHGISFNDDGVVIEAGAMQFHEISGLVEAIHTGHRLAPEEGHVPCLSLGFVASTKDGRVVVERREDGVNCEKMLIQKDCGYFTSRDIPGADDYEDEEYANDPRLFNDHLMLETRRLTTAKFFGIDPECITLGKHQHFLGGDWRAGELYLSKAANIDEVSTKLARNNVHFVDLEDVPKWIANQARLATVDPASCLTNRIIEQPMIGETTLGMLFAYPELSGDTSIDPMEMIDRLTYGGLNIKVFDTSVGQSHSFPTHF